ncbi:MAG TPA: stage II sporulation protein M [Gemmatimonadales bacterium]|nr:stage II sporulation protein M [Gemmatimonadales bacterium]
MSPAAREQTSTDITLREHLGIETPEHVALRLELAGLGSRTAAALFDTVVATVGGTALVVVGAFLLGISHFASLSTWVLALLGLLNAFALLLYFTLFEALHGGRTWGKELLGIRVVLDTGHPITAGAAVTRNLCRLVDCYFPLAPALPGLAMIFLHPRHQRLGDLVAGTVVVRDRVGTWSPAATARADAPRAEGPPELPAAAFRLLDRFLARAGDLDPTVERRLAAELVQRLGVVLRDPTTDPVAALAELHAAELARRGGRFATSAAAGAGRTAVTAERFVAGKRASWQEFHDVATRLERRGVAALSPDEVLRFAARYREIAADLARAHTYRVDPAVIEYLERVTSAGHNALYRARGEARTPVARYLLRDFPAAVVASRRYVLAAALLLGVPTAVGYAMIRARPTLGDELMPLMVSRAAEAAENQRRGIGYAQAPERELPLIAAAIIGNNALVSFWAFVGGVLAGTLTVWLLIQNGLELGMGFGLFANYHAARYLATFVAGHGVLELTAICISAAAGFRVAGAILTPGERTRRDALVIEGRVAARMMGAVVTLLALAGTIEGLLSASDAPAAVKYATGTASGFLLALYFWNGARADAAPEGTPGG